MHDLPAQARRYLVAVYTAALLTLIYASVREGWPSLSASALAGLCVFAAAMIVAEVRPVIAQRTRLVSAASSMQSFSISLHIASIILFGGFWAAVAASVAVAISDVQRRAEWFKAAFNAAAIFITVYWAAWLFAVLRGGRAQLAFPSDYLPAIVLVGAYFLINAALLAGVLALVNGGSFAHTLRDHSEGTSFVFVSEGAVGVLAAFVYRADVWALPFLVPPVVAIFYAYQRWVAMQYETEEAMIALAEVVEDRDPSTARHSQRVAEYAVALGQRIGLDDRHLRSLELAGRLHDLGKIGIDNSVLLKPGLLTAEEYRRMQAHPELSSKILQWFTFAKEEAKYIHLHHERLDGRGYPYGLSGEQIPLPARILSIADAFDAMTTDRPYRAGMSVAEALATLRANAGTQFDAELVEQFVALQQERAAEAVERSPATAIAVLGVEEQ